MVTYQIQHGSKIYSFGQKGGNNAPSLIGYLKDNNLPKKSPGTVTRLLKSVNMGEWVTVNKLKKDGGGISHKIRKINIVTPVVKKKVDISKYTEKIEEIKVETQKIEGREVFFTIPELSLPIQEVPAIVESVIREIPRPEEEIIEKGFTAQYRLTFKFTTAAGDIRDFSTKFVNARGDLNIEMNKLFNKLAFDYNDEFTLNQVSGILRYFKSRSSEMNVGMINIKDLKIMIKVMRQNRSYDGKYDKFLNFLKEKWLFAPKSYKMCFLKSYIVLNNPSLKNQNILANACTRYRDTLGLSKKRSTLGETIEAIKEYGKITTSLSEWKKSPPNILVHSMIDKDEYFDMGHERTIEILMIGQHACAMMPKDIKYKKWITDLDIGRKNCKKILKPGKSKNIGSFPETTIAWDAETKTDENNKLFLISAYWGKGVKWNNGRNVKDPIGDFMNWLSECVEEIPEKSTLILYAHNGGKFDSHYVFKYLLSGNHKFQVPSKIFSKGGRIISFETHVKGRILSFRDSITILSGSLADLTGPKGFDVEHKKKVGDVDMKLFRQDILDKRPDIHDRIITYCDWDARGLYEILEKFYKIIMEAFNMDFRTKMTAASISKAIFLNNYYDPKLYPIYTLSDQIDAFIRRGFCGGRTDLYNKIGVYKQGKYRYVDAISWYPTQMSKYKLPYGQAYQFKGDNKIRRIITKEYKPLGSNADPLEGFVDCWVKSKIEQKIPLYGVKMCSGDTRTKKLIFPNFGNWTRLNLYTEEIKMGMRYDLYEYKFVSAYFFKTSFFYKEFIDDLYLLKKNSAGNPAKKKSMKIPLNSGYGFWAIQRYTQAHKLCVDHGDIYAHLASGTLRNVAQFGKYTMIEKDSYMYNIESNVALGAAITSLARMNLWKYMMEIEDVNFRDKRYENESVGLVCYSDTDSIITTLNVEEEPYFKKKYFSNPGCLGDWTNEISQIREKTYSDYLVTIGPKIYAVEGFTKLKGFAVLEGEIEIDHDNKKIFVNRSEDIPDNVLIAKCLAVEDVGRHKAKLNHEALRLVALGYKIVQKNARIFRGSISNQWFNKKIQENEETIIPVEFLEEKVFKMNYDKQKIVEGDKLVPWTVQSNQNLYRLYAKKIELDGSIGSIAIDDEIEKMKKKSGIYTIKIIN